jgi:aryl-alcohol dehydrogenase-like predicted oxidoreductase
MASEISSSTRFLHAIEMGLGAWEWGDRIMWQYGRTHTEEDVRAAFQVSVQEGIRFIDTAEVYGSGRSERLLGEFVRETQQTVLIATKFFPMPWRLSKDSVPRALRRSLERLGVESLDLYQIHWPTPLLSIESMMDGMVLCVEQGWTRTVGVSNFSSSQMMNAYSALARNKIPLASNQVHFSLLNRDAEKDGLLARARELGVRVIAYSPLEMGILSGKYASGQLPPGPRAAQYAGVLPRLAPLFKVMTEIGQDHGGKANVQVALNWVVCKGALPIPGAKNADQAQQNAGSLGWRLTEEQVARLDEASDAALA